MTSEVDQKQLALPSSNRRTAYICGKRGGNFYVEDLTHIFGISRRDVSEFGCNGCLPRFRNTPAGRWLYEPKKVATAILDGHVWCSLVDAVDVPQFESFRWAVDAFNRNILNVGPCPDARSLRLWLCAVSNARGEEKLMRWQFNNYDGGVSENGNIKLRNHNKKKVVDQAVEVNETQETVSPDSVIDEYAARIDDAIKKAIESGKIAAPYLGQDANANRKKREAPIYIPTLEDVMRPRPWKPDLDEV